MHILEWDHSPGKQLAEKQNAPKGLQAGHGN